MKAVVMSVSMLSALMAEAASFSACARRYRLMAAVSPVAIRLSLNAFSAFLAFLSSLASFDRKSNGILYDWSRKTVFFFTVFPASFRRTAISRASTVVSLIHELSMIPPFSLFSIRL